MNESKNLENKDTQKPENVPFHICPWGPCVVNLKISNEFHQKLLEEARASRTEELNYARRLAGVIKEEYTFRDRKIFLPYLAPLLRIYDSAVAMRLPLPKGSTGKEPRTFAPNEYFLKSLWVNFQKRYEFNPPHNHSDSLSFVIFLQVPPEITAEQKSYVGDGVGPGSLEFFYGEGNRQAITSYLVPPVEKEMYIFPSWLKHYVAPFFSNVTRVSVSGNVADSVALNEFDSYAQEKKTYEIWVRSR